MKPVPKQGGNPMTRLSCADLERLLPDLVLGTLSEAHVHRVARHLRACERCRADRDQYEAVVQLLATEVHDAVHDDRVAVEASHDRLAVLTDRIAASAAKRPASFGLVEKITRNPIARRRRASLRGLTGPVAVAVGFWALMIGRTFLPVSPGRDWLPVGWMLGAWLVVAVLSYALRREMA